MKDYKAVSKYYEETQVTEFLICHLLNEKMPKELKKQGIFFRIQEGSQYNRNDMELVKFLPDRGKTDIIAKIEYECGETQEDWNEEVPRRWQALNLGTRKKYGETFHLFIKSSSTFNSFFAIDCRNNWVQTNFPDIEKLKYNLPFPTDDEFYRIYWKDVNENLYQDTGKKESVVDKNICIVENTNDWSLFYRFLMRRFINEKKGS
jgi:hypothetical protein